MRDTLAPGLATVTVRREIAAPAAELFDAWLDPASLATWMRPGKSTHAVARVEPTVGGGYEIAMHGPGVVHVHSGVYKVIDRPAKLVFTWISEATKQTETLVTVEFRPTRRGTEIVLTHERLPDDAGCAERSHTQGWTEILQILEAQYA